MNLEGLSIDQLRLILRVADEGSFSAAARSVHRAQSAVSYAIAHAEAQLGIVLFDRLGRAPVLTPTGRLLLDDIRNIITRMDGLRARARTVAAGLEAEIVLAVDAVCDPADIAKILRDFHHAFPSVSVKLHTDALGMIVERVLRTGGAIGVVATVLDLPDGLTRYSAPSVEMRAVAARHHPVAVADAAERASVARDSLQIILSDRSERTKGHDFAVCSSSTWRVCDLHQKYHLIKAGVGWGALPTWMIEAEIASGALIPISIASLPDPDRLTTQVFHASGWNPGPAATRIIDALCQCIDVRVPVDRDSLA